MAKPTSSRNRSTRKASRRPTSSANRPARMNASSNSSRTTSSSTRPTNSGARITNAAQRPSGGSARVTGGSRPALPSKPGGALARVNRSGGAATPANQGIQRVSVRDVTGQGGSGGGGSRPSAGLRPGARPGLPGMQGPQPRPRPAQPGTSRPAPPTRQQAAATKLANAAQGTSSSTVRTGRPAPRPGLRGVGTGTVATIGLNIANAIQDRLLSPQQLATKRANEINKDSFYANNNPLKPKPKPSSKPSPTKATAAQISALTDKGGIFNMNGTGNVKPRPKANAGNGGSGGSRGSSGGGGSRPAPAAPKPKPRFTGTVDEGRRIWAEKYSGDKYKGQAIHKEATKALEKMKNNESGKRAQNIGKKGASPAINFETKTKIDSKKVPDFKKIKGRQFGK